MKKLIFILAICFFVLPSVCNSDVYRIDIDGPINSVLADIVVQSMQKAASEKAPLIVLRINTPGGFDQAMRKIIEEILTSRVPVAVYVAPSGSRSASAGFFILVSADLALMAPGTNTGAAHPIMAIGGIYPLDEEKGSKTMSEKITNDAVAYLKGIVEKRKRNVELSEKAVTESKSYTAQEALDGKLIDLIVKDETELLQVLQGRKVTLFSGVEVTLPQNLGPMRTMEMTLRQKILLSISDPNFALLLGLAGLLLLYVEFSNPGMIAPGVIGTLCVLLSLIGFSLLPINFVGVLLLMLALGLFIAEIKVQGFGILGMGGIVSMLIGTLILVDAPQPELRITPLIAVSVVIPFGLIIMLLVRLTYRSLKRKVVTGNEAMIGTIGLAYTALGPEGKVLIRGEYWGACGNFMISEGKKVRVIKVENLKLFVEEVL